MMLQQSVGSGLRTELLRSGGFDYRQKQEIVLFPETPKPAMEFIQPPIQCVPVFLKVVKLPEREADHSAPSSVEIQNEWRHSPLVYSPLHFLTI